MIFWLVLRQFYHFQESLYQTWTQSFRNESQRKGPGWKRVRWYQGAIQPLYWHYQAEAAYNWRARNTPIFLTSSSSQVQESLINETRNGYIWSISCLTTETIASPKWTGIATIPSPFFPLRHWSERLWPASIPPFLDSISDLWSLSFHNLLLGIICVLYNTSIILHQKRTKMAQCAKQRNWTRDSAFGSRLRIKVKW